MAVSNLQREDITIACQSFTTQLKTIFQSKQIANDDALIGGFLTFVHSKVERWLLQFLEGQLECSKLLAEENSKRKQISDHQQDQRVDQLDENFSNLLDFIWREIHYPIFKWFQMWRQHLSPQDKTQQRNYVEFRKMNSKLTKVFKFIHKFYYCMLETLFKKFDMSMVMPEAYVRDLNINVNSGDKAETSRVILSNESPFTVQVIVLIHRSLLYLGTCHRYKTISEKVSNKYNINDFKKSLRYYKYASLILPSVGETNLQQGMIYIQTGNFGFATYEFLRSALSRMPSAAGVRNLTNLLCDKNSTGFQKISQCLNDLESQEQDRNKVINREVMEFYFLALFGYYFAPKTWKNEKISQPVLFNGMNIDHVRKYLFQKMATRYNKNMNIIFIDLLILIGGFDLLLVDSQRKQKISSLVELEPQQVQYLTFTFSFITNILDRVIIHEWKNFTCFEYLAFVRVVECWLKSKRIALQFAHRNQDFCRAMSRLINEILGSDFVDTATLANHRPVRTYFFEEDIMLKEFVSVKYAMSDFNDTLVYEMENASSRLVGRVDDKKSSKDEGILRLESILFSGRKFLANNCVGITWDTDHYVLPTRNEMAKSHPKNQDFGRLTTMNKRLMRENPSGSTKSNTKSQNKNIGKNDSTKNSLSLQELEATMLQHNECMRNKSGWGYSGSSIPTAPLTFDTKPTVLLDDKLVSTAGVNTKFTASDDKALPLFAQENPSSTRSASPQFQSSRSSMDVSKASSQKQEQQLPPSFLVQSEAQIQPLVQPQVYQSQQHSSAPMYDFRYPYFYRQEVNYQNPMAHCNTEQQQQQQQQQSSAGGLPPQLNKFQNNPLGTFPNQFQNSVRVSQQPQYQDPVASSGFGMKPQQQVSYQSTTYGHSHFY